MAGVFYLSAQSSPPVPSRVPDKLLHAIEYSGLSLLVYRALAGGLLIRFNARIVVLTMAITVAYGATDEAHQWFVPLRTADVRDLAADAIGAAIGLLAVYTWHIIRSPKSRISSPKPQR